MWRKILFLILGLLLALSLFIGWIVATPSGLQWLSSQAQKWLPALEIETISGKLVDAVSVQQLRYQPEKATGINIDSLQLDWSPSALVKGVLQVNRLHVDGVSVNVMSSETVEAETETTLPDIVLPVEIELHDVAISNVSLIQQATMTPVLTSLTTEIKTIDGALNIQSLNLVREDVTAALQGKVGLSQPYPLNLSYQAEVTQYTPETLVLNGQAQGDIEALTLTQHTTAPFESELKVNLTDLMTHMNWSSQLTSPQVNLASLVEGQSTQFTEVKFSAEGDLTQLSAQLDGKVKQTDFPLINVAATANSSDFKQWQLAVKTDLSEQQSAQLIAELDLEETLSANAKLSWSNLQWPLEAEQADYQSERGEVVFNGSLADYQLELNSALTVQQQTAELSLQAAGSTEKINVNQLQLSGFDGQLNATGLADWSSPAMQYQLDANWQDIKLPEALTGIAVSLNKGKIALVGTPETLVLSTDATLALNGIASQVTITGSGDYARGFEQTQLEVLLGEGKLAYQGQAFWAGETLADGKLVLDKLNPGIIAPQWPGQLSGGVSIRVDNAENTGLNATLRELDIEGSLRQRPVSLTGNASYRTDLIRLQKLLLTSGNSRLAVEGTIKDQQLGLSFNLNSADLTDFYPEAQGALQIDGKATGKMTLPVIDASINGEKVAFQENSIEKITGKIALGLAPNAPLNTKLNIEKIKLPQLVIDQVSLVLSGKQIAHQLQLSLQSEALNADVSANGGWQNNQWQGAFQRFNFSNQYAGDWQLRQQNTIRLSAKAQSIPMHCWASVNGQLCFSGSQQANQWQTTGSFDRVPLSLLEGFVESLSQVRGELRGEFNVAAGQDKIIQGQGAIYLDNASVQIDQEALNQKQAIALKETVLEFNTDATRSRAYFHLAPDLEGVSAIEAELNTVGISTLIKTPDSAEINGRVTTAIQDLALLELTHPAIESLKGALNMDVTVSGTVAQPQIQGLASLKGGQVRIVDAGILLKEITANVDGNLNSVDFDYHAKSGDGELNGLGRFQLTEQAWELTTEVKATQFRVLNTPEMLVIAEPDLSLLMNPELTRVTGKVHIPYAELEPKQFNTTVSPNADVVVIRENQTETKSGAATEVDVTISLGDKVKLKAMGFQGRLAGNLRVKGNTSDVLRGNGEILIKEGSYLAYGQLLKVDDGRIRFAGNIENPELDIKAVREGRDYTAGLHIEGNVSSPVATLFSDPTMDQDNILSYILLGKPIEQASATDAAILASAATGMGLQNGAMIGDQIANTFGLDEFSVGGDSAENAAVRVGKYLSPKLYLSYGIGVFEPVSIVELRYQLSKIWALRAESGTESGVDLLYTYERSPKK